MALSELIALLSLIVSTIIAVIAGKALKTWKQQSTVDLARKVSVAAYRVNQCMNNIAGIIEHCFQSFDTRRKDGEPSTIADYYKKSLQSPTEELWEAEQYLAQFMPEIKVLWDNEEHKAIKTFMELSIEMRKELQKFHQFHSEFARNEIDDDEATDAISKSKNHLVNTNNWNATYHTLIDQLKKRVHGPVLEREAYQHLLP